MDRPIPPAPTDAGPDLADSRSRRPIDASAEAGIDDVRADEPPAQSAIPDGGYLVVDDFGDGRAGGWQVQPWTDASVPGSGWLASASDAGSIYAQESLDATGWLITYSMKASSSDQIVEARMRVVDFYARAPSYAAALFGRYHPGTDSGYLVALRGDGSLVIRRRDRGITSSWNGGVALGIEPGVWYTVRLEILGGTINAYLDGTFVCSVTDASPLPAGGVALGTFGARVEVDRVLLAAP